jgi:hypothetical protein
LPSILITEYVTLISPNTLTVYRHHVRRVAVVAFPDFAI